MQKLRVSCLFETNDLKALLELQQLGTTSPIQTDASHRHTSLGTLGSAFKNFTVQTSGQDNSVDGRDRE